MTELKRATIDVLVIGAGWTSQFLIPRLDAAHLTYKATSTTGRDDTVKFKYDPEINDTSYFSILPDARYLLITFPLRGAIQTRQFLDAYKLTRERGSSAGSPRVIQLGSTGIWQSSGPTVESTTTTESTSNDNHWITRHSVYDTSNLRAQAEDELLARKGCVVNLAGLWGAKRDPKTWVDRVAPDKEKLEGKSSLHMIHGVDVARAIVAVIRKWDAIRNTTIDGNHACAGQRYMLTDGLVYDWWELMLGWADNGSVDESVDREPSRQAQWVYELMRQHDIRALPRSMQQLGRCYDSRDFWQTFALVPLKSRL